MIYVGIDPGLSGGIGVISSDNTATAYKYTSAKLIEVIKSLVGEDVYITVEQVHAMPHQGVTSMFTFGTGYGMILGILEALGREYHLAKPQTWKKVIGVTYDKSTSIKKAQLLFPDTSLLPSTRCRKPSDGMAEALLIAEYGRRIHNKQKQSIIKEFELQ